MVLLLQNTHTLAMANVQGILKAALVPSWLVTRLNDRCQGDQQRVQGPQEHMHELPG
jgi:hypothetical protein